MYDEEEEKEENLELDDETLDDDGFSDPALEDEESGYDSLEREN